MTAHTACVTFAMEAKMASTADKDAARFQFQSLLRTYYAGRAGAKKKPWTNEHVSQVIQYIHRARVALQTGRRRSAAEHYFSRCYDVAVIDGVERVVIKKSEQDGCIRIMLPVEEFYFTMKCYHEKMGHVGFDKISDSLREKYVIPRIVINMFLRCCSICSNKSVLKALKKEANRYSKLKRKALNSGSMHKNILVPPEHNIEDGIGRTHCGVDELCADINPRHLLDYPVPHHLHVPQQTPPVTPKPPVQAQSQQPPPQQLQQPQQTQKKVQPQSQSLKPIAPKPSQPRPVSPLQPPPPPPEVCLRWNSYHSNMQATFPSLLNNEQFVDVTLACEGRSIKCHKMMLSACSVYFEELLSQNPCQHPIVLMKDLRYWEVQALVDFMYRGEVNVGQDKLPLLLAAAEALQIKGLAGPATSSHEEDMTPSLIPQSSAEDYLEESIPSPSSARRARKRRVLTAVQSSLPQPQQSQQSQQIPLTSRVAVNRQKLVRPSTSNFTNEGVASMSSEPPIRRARKSDSGEFVGEIKIEPIDIEISNDSTENIHGFLEKAYEGSETGDGGESSGQGDDPGGSNEMSKSMSNCKAETERQDCEQMDFRNSGMTSGNDHNFSFEDNAQDEGLRTIPCISDTSYHDPLAQPGSSGISKSNSSNLSDSILDHL